MGVKKENLKPDDERHGLYTTYSNWECRCDRCKKGWAAYKATLRRRRKAQKQASETLPL